MPSVIDETVFGDPSSGLGVVYLCCAVLLAAQQGYYVSAEGTKPLYAVLFLIAGMALSGIAQSLPKPRRRAAGVLWLTTLVVVVSMPVIVVVSPELLTN